jgi:hypothetical protein
MLEVRLTIFRFQDLDVVMRHAVVTASSMLVSDEPTSSSTL